MLFYLAVFGLFGCYTGAIQGEHTRPWAPRSHFTGYQPALGPPTNPGAPGTRPALGGGGRVASGHYRTNLLKFLLDLSRVRNPRVPCVYKAHLSGPGCGFGTRRRLLRGRGAGHPAPEEEISGGARPLPPDPGLSGGPSKEPCQQGPCCQSAISNHVMVYSPRRRARGGASSGGKRRRRRSGGRVACWADPVPPSPSSSSARNNGWPPPRPTRLSSGLVFARCSFLFAVPLWPGRWPKPKWTPLG